MPAPRTFAKTLTVGRAWNPGVRDVPGETSPLKGRTTAICQCAATGSPTGTGPQARLDVVRVPTSLSRFYRGHAASLKRERSANNRLVRLGLASLDLGDQSTSPGDDAGSGGRQDQVDRISAVASPCNLVDRRSADDHRGQGRQELARRWTDDSVP